MHRCRVYAKQQQQQCTIRWLGMIEKATQKPNQSEWYVVFFLLVVFIFLSPSLSFRVWIMPHRSYFWNFVFSLMLSSCFRKSFVFRLLLRLPFASRSFRMWCLDACVRYVAKPKNEITHYGRYTPCNTKQTKSRYCNKCVHMLVYQTFYRNCAAIFSKMWFESDWCCWWCCRLLMFFFGFCLFCVAYVLKFSTGGREREREASMCERVYFPFSFFCRLWFALSHKSIHSRIFYYMILKDTHRYTHTHSHMLA